MLATALLQTSALPSLSPWAVVPDLMLLVVVSWGLLRGVRESVPWAVGGGLMLDLLSGGPFGATTVSLTLSSAATSLEELNIFRDSPWLPPVASVLATVAYNGIYFIILRVAGRPMQHIPSLPQVILPCIMLNALVMYPTYWVMRWLHQRTSPAR